MRNFRRRIEALEKSSSGQHDALRNIGKKATGPPLWPDQVELLVAAFGADRVGRPLTEPEVSASRAYTEALERECRWAGLPATTGSTLAVDLHYAAICVLAFRLSDEQLQLCRSGVTAAQQGREPSEREAAAIHAHNAETERLSLLAGFGSAAEFEAFRPQTEFSQEGDQYGYQVGSGRARPKNHRGPGGSRSRTRLL